MLLNILVILGRNILLDGAQKNTKLADFGICTIMEVRSCPLCEVYIFFCPKNGSKYTVWSQINQPFAVLPALHSVQFVLIPTSSDIWR